MDDKLKRLKQDMESQYFNEVEFSEFEKEKIRKAVKGEKRNRLFDWTPRVLTVAFYICVLFVLGNLILNNILSDHEQLQASNEEEVEQISTSTPKEPLTRLGGYYDDISYIEKNMEEYKSGVYTDAFISDQVKVICRFVDYQNHCGDPFFYFIQDANTVEEAFLVLQDHLPTDVMKENEIDLSDKGYVMNLYSKKVEESLPGKNGFFHIIFKFDSEGKIFAATTGLDTYKKSE